MDASSANQPRRARKSAPVKNAVFVGAIHKERLRSKVPDDQADIPQPSTSLSKSRNSYTKKRNDSQVRRSRPSEPVSRTPVRMSTPVRSSQTSPRYRTRNRSKQDESDSMNRSRSIISSLGSRRRFHPDYDPLIEIRRAQERLERYRTHGDWKIDLLLCDDADEDLQRYEDKLKRRQSLRGDLMEPIELERRQMELLRRQKDIDLGKVTDRYAEYVLSIPKPERQRYHPRTPNKFRKVSRRAWDGMIRKWRKHLHSFDDLNFEESWRSLSTADLSGISGLSSPHSSLGGLSNHDLENLDPAQSHWSAQKITLSTEFENANAAPASPTLKMSFRQKQAHGTFDDEDTLQAHPKVSADYPKLEDEDTLSGLPNILSKRRSTRNSNRLAPTPDVLHSGLTNDMNALAPVGQKRLGSHLDQPPIDVNSYADFPALHSSLASPSKRIKRGILTQNGLTGRVN